MSFIWKTLAGFFGLGFVPLLPGTIGSLGAIPLFLLLAHLNWPLYFLTVMAFTFLSLWICQKALPLFQDTNKPEDPSRIVIDEVAGLLWALGIVRYLGLWKPEEGFLWLLLIPFVFFRLFDVTKWGPVGWAERRFSGAAGIVLDDVLAGILAGIVSILFCVVYPFLIYGIRSMVHGPWSTVQ
ncbi:MAG: phosphatidylglycerophosphatase A [Deltaproteobacteria bacterium]|nr:phosphatidylglycerophosphatase A [Deltaproteobacteria bacterium]MBI4224308.1 phosphatidylglycerophosphatase A [Deltaproteobacteria bacterium]